MAQRNEEMISCEGCHNSAVVPTTHTHCNACHDDLTRISKNTDISAEVKKYVTDNYSKYLQWLIAQNKKFEWQAEYHTFQDTCEDFYINSCYK